MFCLVPINMLTSNTTSTYSVTKSGYHSFDSFIKSKITTAG